MLITENFSQNEISFNNIGRKDCIEFIKQHYLGSFPAVSTDYIGVY